MERRERVNVYYNEVDITGSVAVSKANLYDYAGGKLDRAELDFDDRARDWLRWGARKGDTVRVTSAGYDTGIMYVDELKMAGSKFAVGAVSAPPKIRETGTRAWENVRLVDLLAEFASRAGLRLETYNTPDNQMYARVEQKLQQDIAWLSERCALESCVVKITNGVLVAYGETWLEGREPAGSINAAADDECKIVTTSVGVYAGCRVIGAHTGEWGIPGAVGPWLTKRAADLGLAVRGQGDAERYAKGLLRAHNKYEHTMTLRRPLDTEMAGGMALEVTGAGAAWSGKWMIDGVRHDLINKRTYLNLRKPLEGY